MNRKLLRLCLGSYIVFLAGSFLAALFLTPTLLQHAMLSLSDDPKYRQFILNHPIALQNVCYILLLVVFLMSLVPMLIFLRKFYHPLYQIIEKTNQLTEGGRQPSISYSKEDELGVLADSVNYLADTVNNSGESQRKFISNISHDFRSPLTSIKGYVEAMLDGTIPVEMQERYLRIVLGETERLNKLTEELLVLNTFDDRGVFLDLSDFDIIPVIQHMIESSEVLCKSKNLRIKTLFSAESVLVHADQSKIQQVLYNLLDNAIKFSYADSEIQISVSVRKKRVFVSVKDFGEGISKENQSKIWERFYKTDASRGRDKKGTGLGLSIVNEIIRAHKQNIDVISTEGVGTEFVFTLKKS